MFKIGHFFAGFKKSLHFTRRYDYVLYSQFDFCTSGVILRARPLHPCIASANIALRPICKLIFPKNLKINIIYINFHLRVILIKIIHFSPEACSFTDILQNHTRTLFCLDIYFVKLLDFCYKI